MISAIFLYTLPLTNLNGRLAALYMSYFYLGPYIVSLGINTANTAGHTKKVSSLCFPAVRTSSKINIMQVTTNALIFIAYCVSNIIAPQFFKAKQAPLYPLGMGAILGSYVMSIIIIVLYAAYCWNENRKRDRVDADKDKRVHGDTDFKDLTDKQNPHFRYCW
jgi:MFS transporter, ACS family, allantoate permease